MPLHPTYASGNIVFTPSGRTQRSPIMPPITPKLVTITTDGPRYLATVDGGPQFEVGRRVTYAAPPPRPSALPAARARPTNTTPTTLPPSTASGPTSSAHRTVRERRPLRHAEHVRPRLLYLGLPAVRRACAQRRLRRLLPPAPRGPRRRQLLPRPHRHHRPHLPHRAHRPPSRSSPTPPPSRCMTYLNPTIQAVEEIEAVNAAKLVHWSSHSAAAMRSACSQPPSKCCAATPFACSRWPPNRIS